MFNTNRFLSACKGFSFGFFQELLSVVCQNLRGLPYRIIINQIWPNVNKKIHFFSLFFIPLKTNKLRVFVEICDDFVSSCDFHGSYDEHRNRADAVFDEKITVFFHVSNLIRVRIKAVFKQFARTAELTCSKYWLHGLIILKVVRALGNDPSSAS